MTNVTTLWKILFHGYDFLLFLLKFLDFLHQVCVFSVHYSNLSPKVVVAYKDHRTVF